MSCHPTFKVTVTHGGSDITYESRVFSPIQIKRRECNYDTAALTAENAHSMKYLGEMQKFDVIKIWVKRQPWETYTTIPQFGGIIRQANPSMHDAPAGNLLNVICKGYGSALEDTHCNRDYGVESSNPTLDTAKEIWSDLVDNMINKSLGSADNTGYAITKTKIADIAAATPIKYLNNPYRANIEVIDTVCDLTSAIGAGTTAGAHWIVDPNKNLIINTIGAHENTTEWPDWWNINQAGSTLTQGVDFTEYAVLDKAEEFANKIVLVTDFRRPSYDYITEGNAALWVNVDLVGITNNAGDKVVGADCLDLEADAAAHVGKAYYPSTQNLGWNVTKWGSSRTLPRLNFYFKKDSNTAEVATELRLCTTNYNTDYFYLLFSNWSGDPDNEWIHRSIPTGPYYSTVDETRKFTWNTAGSPDWTNINAICFSLLGGASNAHLLIDDLHFSGKIIRSAKNSTNITANKEIQKVLIARNAMDDSCVAADDSGFAGRIAYAELLRRTANPITISFSISLQPSMMAGQKLHVHAEKQLDGTTYRINTDMRITEVTHNITEQSATSTVTATSDLKNTRPINIPDQYAMWQENMFINSNEAKNIRAGGEVDLLIPIIEKDYPV